MNVKPYQYLLAIAEHGSISKAASALQISQPALSKFLQNTEAELSAKLFCRDSANRMSPTAAGKVYLQAAQQIIEIKKQTYSMITRLSAPPIETLVVGVSPFRGSRVLSSVFRPFYERFADVHLEIVEGYMEDLKQMIRRGELSLALGTITPEEEDEFGFVKIGQEQLKLAVPLSHPVSALSNESGSFFPEIELSSLFDTPFVAWGEKTTNRKVIDRHLSQIHFHPTIVYDSNNAMMVNDMLKQGIGAGFLPEPFCQPGENRAYFSIWPPMSYLVGIYYYKDRALSDAERYLVYLTLTREVLSSSWYSGKQYNREALNILEEFGRETGNIS